MCRRRVCALIIETELISTLVLQRVCVCFNSLSCPFVSIPTRPPTLRVRRRLAASFRFSPSPFDCPLKARGDADQPSSSRSCPKKTILLPSSASSLSLHSEVTHSLIFVSCSPVCPDHPILTPPPPSLKTRVMDVSFHLCSASANKALCFPRVESAERLFASLRSVFL